MADGKNIVFQKIYFYVLVLIAVSLPLSRYFMSVGSFLLLALWLWSDFQSSVAIRFFKQKGFLKGLFILLKYLWALARESSVEKTRLFLQNKAAVVFAGIYLLEIAGLFFTANFDQATHTLRIMLPLVLFPLVFSSTSKIDYAGFRQLMLFYVAAILVGTLAGALKIISGNFTNVREFSPFISAIRFGLNVSFGIMALAYFVVKDPYFSRLQKLLMGLLIVWFVWFLIKMESLTALSLLLLLAMGVMIYFGFQTKKRWVKAGIVLAFIIVPYGSYLYVKKEVTRMTHVRSATLKNPVKYTALGNKYVFDTVNYGIEDGRYVGAYLCIPELKKAWDKRSSLGFGSRDGKGNQIQYTLIRYMTSKGLTKDSVGVSRLTDKDVGYIQQGVANYNYVAHPGLRSRLLIFLTGWENFKKTGKAEGNSVLQRYEFLRAALVLAKQNFWTGVGTGDLRESLGEQYRIMNSGVAHCFGYIAHNQYIGVFASFGIFGFLYFLFALIYPPLKTHSFNDYFFVVFYVILLVSMLSDDTLEMHSGVTLFAFFASLLMFGKEKPKEPLSR